MQFHFIESLNLPQWKSTYTHFIQVEKKFLVLLSPSPVPQPSLPLERTTDGTQVSIVVQILLVG